MSFKEEKLKEFAAILAKSLTMAQIEREFDTQQPGITYLDFLSSVLDEYREKVLRQVDEEANMYGLRGNVDEANCLEALKDKLTNL